MIIKRNDFTKYLESKITKEQNRVLQSTPGFRVKYINLLSLLTEMSENDYHYVGTAEWQSDIYALTPETFKKIFEEKHPSNIFSFHSKFRLEFDFIKLPSDLMYKYGIILNELFFDFIKNNKNADFYNIKYMVKMIENILKLAKFKIDDF